MLKYNLVDDELYFKDRDNRMLAFVEPVSEFSITYKDNNAPVTKHYRQGYLGMPRATPNSYFEVLCDGKSQLLKRTTKILFETQAFNSSTKTQSFQENVNYYLITAGKVIPVKREETSILHAIPDKHRLIQQFVKTNNLSFKTDTDLALIITAYNAF